MVEFCETLYIILLPLPPPSTALLLEFDQTLRWEEWGRWHGPSPQKKRQQPRTAVGMNVTVDFIWLMAMATLVTAMAMVTMVISMMVVAWWKSVRSGFPALTSPFSAWRTSTFFKNMNLVGNSYFFSLQKREGTVRNMRQKKRFTAQMFPPSILRQFKCTFICIHIQKKQQKYFKIYHLAGDLA